MDKYAYYQTEDFLRDDSFINWVLDPEGAGNEQWTQWMNTNPVKRETAQKAMDIIRSFDFKKEPVGDRFYADLKQRIDQTIAMQQPRPVKNARVIPAWLKVAAVAAALVIGAVVLNYFLKPSWITISTPYAAIKAVQLPDGSEVVLNANSTIRYRKEFTRNGREIWLTGEAFFTIQHISNGNNVQHCVVHAGTTNIEVLGTAFNVKSINTNTAVMLRQGRVQFSAPASHVQTIMHPNDYCQYNAAQGKMTTRVTNPLLYTSWMEHQYQFEKTPASEVCETLKEYFGYDFIIQKPGVASQPISGTLELQNEEVMLKVLSTLLNASVTKKGNSVVIE